MYDTPTIKPIDVPNFSKDVMVAGQGAAQAIGGISEGITAVNKEKKRQELIQQLQQQKPFLEVDPGMPFDALAQGLHQINQVSLRYDLAKKAGARLPDEAQMYKAAFHADEKSVEKFSSVLDELGKTASTEQFKQQTEQKAEQRSGEQTKLMSDYMLANPNASEQEALAAISQKGFSPKAAGPEGMQAIKGMATDAYKAEELRLKGIYQQKRLQLMGADLMRKTKKDKDDSFARDVAATAGAFLKNMDVQMFRINLQAKAKDARAKAQGVDPKTGIAIPPAQAKEWNDKATLLENAVQSFGPNGEGSQEFAAGVQGIFNKRYGIKDEAEPKEEESTVPPPELVQTPAGGLPGAHPTNKKVWDRATGTFK